MPFVYDLRQADQDDSGPPSAEKFVYLPSPEYTGSRLPARFSIVPAEPAELQPLAEPLPPLGGRRSFIDWLLRRGQQQVQRYLGEQLHRSNLMQRQLLSIMVPALRAVGVRRAYCRYDGGCDEGFAWLDGYEMDGGARLDDEALGLLLDKTNIRHELSAAGLTRGAGSGEPKNLVNFASVRLSQAWASILLGNNFGTGEYLMYGAFTVDLDECIISDDPNADPIVKSIGIVQ